MSALDQLGGGGPPPSIPLPSGGGPSGPGAGGSGPDGPDSPDVEKAVNDAISSIQTALDGENDPGDKAILAKILADLHKYLGDQSALVDKVMGGGPGSKLIRKATGTAAPSAPSGPGGY